MSTLTEIKGTGTYSIQEYKMQSGLLPVLEADRTFSSVTGNWLLTGESNINSGVLNIKSTAGVLSMARYANINVIGHYYKITYNISRKASGQLLSDYLPFFPNSEVGDHTYYYTAISADVNFKRSGITDIDIDSVSIVELLPLPSFKTNQRYLQCDVAGTIAFNSQQAFGVWEWDWYKGGTGNEFTASFIAPKRNIVNTYIFQVYSTEGFFFTRFDGVTEIILSSTISSYIQNNTWYRIRITRTLTGSFALLIKGGNFTPTAGYDGWTLVSTTGGSGTNPVVDLTYTTSNFMVFDLDAGDRITNINLEDGIFQP